METVTGCCCLVEMKNSIAITRSFFSLFKCSSKEGRDGIVQHPCIAQLITNTSALLSSKNSWIASNAALVLAR